MTMTAIESFALIAFGGGVSMIASVFLACLHDRQVNKLYAMLDRHITNLEIITQDLIVMKGKVLPFVVEKNRPRP